MHPYNRRLVHTEGPSGQLRCHAIVQHAAVPNTPRRAAGLHVSLHTLHAILSSAGACLPGFAVGISRSGWQAEEAVANLPLRLAVRALRPPSSAGVLQGY